MHKNPIHMAIKMVLRVGSSAYNYHILSTGTNYYAVNVIMNHHFDSPISDSKLISKWAPDMGKPTSPTISCPGVNGSSAISCATTWIKQV